MAKVLITSALKQSIYVQFKDESILIFERMKALETSPKRGKTLSSVGGIVIKELRYGKYRFYFLTDGHMLKFGSTDELASLVIKFVKMSNKKSQQNVINELKKTLQSFGFQGF